MKCTHKMDRPCSIRGWKVSWQMLLFADFILSSCFLLTQAQDSLGRPFSTEAASVEPETATFTTEETAAGTIISTTEEQSDLHKEKNFIDTEKGVRRKSYGTPTQVISVTPLYENISPAQKVVHNNSSDADQVYESLQHGDQNVYNELMFRQNPSEAPSVRSSP